MSSIDPNPDDLIVAYFGLKTESGVQGIFRRVEDIAQRWLAFQRPDAASSTDGVWIDDPSLIDELSEPGVVELTPEEVEQFLGGVPPPPDVPAADERV